LGRVIWTGSGNSPVSSAMTAALVAAVAQAPVVHPRRSEELTASACQPRPQPTDRGFLDQRERRWLRGQSPGPSVCWLGRVVKTSPAPTPVSLVQDRPGRRWLVGQSPAHPEGPGKVEFLRFQAAFRLAYRPLRTSPAHRGKCVQFGAFPSCPPAMPAERTPTRALAHPLTIGSATSPAPTPEFQDQREHRWLGGQSPTRPRGPAPGPIIVADADKTAGQRGVWIIFTR
jgi:hypothetical protein